MYQIGAFPRITRLTAKALRWCVREGTLPLGTGRERLPAVQRRGRAGPGQGGAAGNRGAPRKAGRENPLRKAGLRESRTPAHKRESSGQTA